MTGMEINGNMGKFILSLNGEWSLSGRRECGCPPSSSFEGEFRVPARVPGNIEESLALAGKIGDPYVRLHAMALRPYEFYEWVYVRTFAYDGAARKLRLICEGLDCIATLFVNGVEIGRSENAMIPHVFPVDSALLKQGQNELAVHLASANNAFRKYPFQANALSAYPYNYESIRIRKPAHAWGWDIAPRMALGGIFRDIRLEEIPPFEIEETTLQLEGMDGADAKMLFGYKIRTEEFSLDDDLAMTVEGICGDSSWRAQDAVWSVQGVFRFRIPQVKLWWPRHYGAPNLYQVRVSLLRKSTGAVLAEKNFTAGVREIRLFRREVWTEEKTPDFQFYVNGRPVRIFGCNHVPADALHSRDPQRLEKVVDMACDLDCNMLRVWGGGIYECENFYDRCDRAGILLWHDFMMGCANYPQDLDFCQVLREEAEAAVRRLRQHPCIALWAGDNECDCLTAWGIPQDPNQNTLTRSVLPDVCRRLDPFRPYLPSSPWYSPESVRRSRQIGERDPMFFAPEQHLWGPRDYFKSDFYRTTRASFTSEIGYHGCPGAASIRRFISPEKLWPWKDNEEWNYHASNPFLKDDSFQNYRIGLMADQIREMFGMVPDNLEEFAFASQICQAEAKKYFVELVRSRPKMSGILWWNLVDCWPQFSDAVVDYYYSKKLAYHYIRRLQHPVLLLMPEAENWHQALLAVNDSAFAAEGTYSVTDAESGSVFSSGGFSLGAGECLELASQKVCTTGQRLFLIRWELSDGTHGCNHAMTGHPQYELGRYRKWLDAIAALDGAFIPEKVGL